MPRIFMAHMIVAPFVQHAAAALHEAGLLAAFGATLVDHPESGLQEVAKRLAPLVGYDLAGQLQRRRITAFPEALVQHYPWREVVRMLQVKLRADPVLGDRIFHWARDGFDHWVAGRLDGHGGFYGYEYGARESLKRARALGIPGFLDLPSPEHDFSEGIIAAEVARFPDLQSDYRTHVSGLQDERTEYRREEWEAASHIVTASTLTRDSWVAKGWSPRPVAVIPYGAPPVRESYLRAMPDEQPLRFVWAGTFSIRKGAHLLIEAWRSWTPSHPGIELHIYGAVTLPEKVLADLPTSIVFHGSVAQHVLFEALAGSAALVFPTLCDGFGMVVTEAFALGVPVITTERAGAVDLVRQGENGLRIAAGSAQAIAEALDAFMDLRADWPAMRHAAAETARGWQWSDYRRELSRFVGQALMEPVP